MSRWTFDNSLPVKSAISRLVMVGEVPTIWILFIFKPKKKLHLQSPLAGLDERAVPARLHVEPYCVIASKRFTNYTLTLW
jgi:hypothetical protein